MTRTISHHSCQQTSEQQQQQPQLRPPVKDNITLNDCIAYDAMRYFQKSQTEGHYPRYHPIAHVQRETLQKILQDALTITDGLESLFDETN
jgi:hypothetical protein